MRVGGEGRRWGISLEARISPPGGHFAWAPPSFGGAEMGAKGGTPFAPISKRGYFSIGCEVQKCSGGHLEGVFANLHLCLKKWGDGVYGLVYEPVL